MRRITTTRGNRLEALILVGALLISTATACGSDDGGADEDTMDVAAWVEQFDSVCVETAEKLSDTSLSDEQFAEINREALAGMRALPSPDSMLEEATVLLDVIEATNLDTSLDEETIDNLEDDFLDAAAELGVSAACVYGASD